MPELISESVPQSASESAAAPQLLPLAAFHKPHRRDFFKALGAGFTFLLARPAESEAQESGRGNQRQSTPQDLSAWLHIGSDGMVTVNTGKVEIGQNARTALTQAVAEELNADPQSIRMVMGDTDLVPFDMGTFGSLTTPMMAPVIRRAAATARELLIDLAAKRWSVDRSALRLHQGAVVNPAIGNWLTYAELAAGQNFVGSISAAPIRQPLGQSLPKVNGADFVNGSHQYASDVKLPGMLYGSVLRPPQYGAKLTALDSAPAGKFAAVQVVRDGEFAAAVGPNSHVVRQALASLRPEWQMPAEQPSAKDLFARLRNTADPKARITSAGDMDAAWRDASKKLETTYTVAYIAHTPLEPRTALASWADGKLTVWTGSQRPFGVRSELMEHFHLPESKVRVIVPDMGAGYGGKHSGECAIEAGRLAQATGKPVKVTWTRQEEFTWAYFRPAGVIDVRGAVDDNGRLAGWEFHNFNSGPSGLGTPYDVAAKREGFHPSDSPLRQGSYRGLASTANNFARESHMDSLARAANIDPLEFRRRNLKDPRLLAVLDAASSRFGWGNAVPSGHGVGLACGTEKGGFVACCVQISLEKVTRAVKVERAVTAFECGAVINPEHLKNQVEGSVVMGLGGALFEAIHFGEGRITNASLAAYRVPRFSDVPELETILVDRRDLPPAGAGETPIMAIAPAIRNAILQLTGQHLNSLPLAPDGVPPAA
jgi:nicotinate dehydrogenase subunit B